MWAALGGASTEPDPVPEEEKCVSIAQDSTANLNAALLGCIGEESHKLLRQKCGLLIRNELRIDEFHSSCISLFQDKVRGMTLYRRLVLSLPDGDKSAMLLSLVDEAVALAKKSESEDKSPKKENVDNTQRISDCKNGERGEQVAEIVASTPTIEKESDVHTENKPSPANAAEEKIELDVTDSNLLIEEKKQAVQSKEKAILSVMAKRQADLAKEKQALDMIRSEMAALSRQQSNEITEVITKLGETDKDLWYLERDFKAAETEYLKCKARYEKMNLAKTNMVAHLTSLTLNAERRKEEKLNTIMEKLKSDGVVFPGAALAGLT